MELRKRTYSGTRSQEVTEREKQNRLVARKAAAEGFVLLKNEGMLPLAAHSKVALFGGGSCRTIKGGTGSGDVNERESVSIWQGMKDSGFTIVNEAWLQDYAALYEQKRIEWRDMILRILKEKGDTHAFFDVYSGHPFQMPAGRPIEEADLGTDRQVPAFFVVNRIAGEGQDRFPKKGDYLLTDEEYQQLKNLCGFYEKVAVVINAGGVMDLGFMDELPIQALIVLSQPGMEGGSAFADAVSGQTPFSGKLTSTWARRYEDYPTAKTFSHNNGNVQQEKYEEGLYVGYRYFDSFAVEPRYPFGYGLSYTTFALQDTKVALLPPQQDEARVCVTVTVTNTGDSYKGKEVVQVYASCPEGRLTKETKRLCAYAKTKWLQPGEKETLSISFPISQLASFSEEENAWLLEKGEYGILVGNSSRHVQPVAVLDLKEDRILTRVDPICPLQEPLTEIHPQKRAEYDFSGCCHVTLDPEWVHEHTVQYQETPEWQEGPAGEIANSLTPEQLIALSCGDPGKGQDSTVGAAGLTVPGAAGETNNLLENTSVGLASIVLADGPAGLRLHDEYQVGADGQILVRDFQQSVEKGLFFQKPDVPNTTTYYQYCTAIPVGTLLAQTWNTDLIEEVGAAIGREMEEFQVTLWLAPGMNIHRDPLCGRNFEYYSEDPLLSGTIAAAMTNGVQSLPGVGTTIKHFCCNNQEDNRMGSNSIVSQRTMRELYLHAFEIAVKTSQPMSIMTSYNAVNGVHTANSYDLITKTAREEWGFAGVVMTDWGTTASYGGSSAAVCMQAGNDLIMPGTKSDLEGIRLALEGKGDISLPMKEMRKCIAHLIHIILSSNRYEGCKSYTSQFENLRPFVQITRE